MVFLIVIAGAVASVIGGYVLSKMIHSPLKAYTPITIFIGVAVVLMRCWIFDRTEILGNGYILGCFVIMGLSAEISSRRDKKP